MTADFSHVEIKTLCISGVGGGDGGEGGERIQEEKNLTFPNSVIKNVPY